MSLKFSEESTIIKNFLSEEDFSFLKNNITSVEFPFYLQKGIVDNDDGEFYMCHRIYEDGKPLSDIYDWMRSKILPKLEVQIVLRSKINLYSSTEIQKEHDFHTDYPFKCKTALLSINTCNGYTVLEDGTKLDSIENQMVIFDANKPHASASCTDENWRMNLVLNYIPIGGLN